MPAVFAALFLLLVSQRLLEMALSARNRRWALACGGMERGNRFFPVVVAVHTLFFVSLWLEWRYRSPGWSAAWPLWLGLLLAAQLLRLWSIRSLGLRWNTRIIVIPGSKPVTDGPYRFVRHPNYLAVIVELVAVPVMCGAYITAAVFTAANALILIRRIPEEERALAEAGGTPLENLPRFIPRF